MMKCRFCQNPLTHEFVDLAHAPPSNSFLRADQLHKPELYFPLNLYVCEKCFLVQIDEHERAENIFSSDYVYFSSFSKSWLEHCRKYADQVTDRFKLGASSRVVELASNDGYLLQFFQKKGISVLGIEPAGSTAQVAITKGIPTLVRFFGKACASDVSALQGPADLMAANNVLAHVPDINDFVGGIKILLGENGVFTGEFPHLLQLVKQGQFDTIYHEHFSYFSFGTISKIFEHHGLRIFDVEELPTHGGSLRIYADHGAAHALSPAVAEMQKKEREANMHNLAFYSGFQDVTNRIKHQFLKFLLDAADSGKKVAAYGAAAKGNTLLNACGVKKDLLQFVVDASPHKQGRFLPGSHVPVVDSAFLRKEKPDYIVILPWNISQEIMEQLSYVKEWGGRFVVAIPELRVY